MTMISLASVKGSPGVTTTALLFGALWPRQSLMVEADPSGGDVALRMPDESGQPLDPARGLLSLVAAGRRSIYPHLVRQHAQTIVGGLDVVAGVGAPEQAAGITQWDELGRMLARLPGADVVADLGRIGPETAQNPLIGASSALCLMTTTVPSQIVHLRAWLRRLRETYPALPRPHVIVVAPAKRSRAVTEVREILDQAGTEISGVHHLAEDTAGAAFFLGQVTGRPQRTHLVRSAQPIVTELAEATEAGFIHTADAETEPDEPQEAS